MNNDSIYLADLTHDGLLLSSNVFPLSIGLIAAYFAHHRAEKADVELFKYPGDFSEALERKAPRIVGFANYSWNFALSREYARQIKKLWPETIIVFGGPNYGLTEEELVEFWRKYEDIVDFHVVKEGEESFVHLYDALEEFDFDAAALKTSLREIGNVHYSVGGNIVTGPNLPRVTLAELPSPYLMGLMDKFFDDKLCPLIHTTRGCPFKCAFCTEGAEYYNKVQQRVSPLQEEMTYISKRIRGPKDLFITDANFGMFKQDYEKAEILAQCQRDYGYPKYVHVSTGKNQKDRVIEIVQSLNGAVSMAASLQSTDETVLANIERSNISVEKLAEAGQKANTLDTGTYSELILGLPGDSLQAHKQSLRDTVNMRFDNIRMYQLIMLPQTKLNTPENRRQYGMQTKFRIMPRSFGEYSLAGTKFVAVESEEILIGSNSLPNEDYVAAREMDLTIEILHNGRAYTEAVGVCDTYGLSWFDDVVMRFYDRRRELGDDIAKMYDDFVQGTTERLWPTEEALVGEVSRNISEMLIDERGTNEMSTGKATAFFKLFEPINSVLFSLLREVLEETGQYDDDAECYLGELERYSLLRKQNLLGGKAQVTETFSINLEKVEKERYKISAKRARLPENRRYSLIHNQNQKQLIEQYSDEFGNSFDGLGKLLMRYPHIHRLFRVSQATV